jgi:hypothetical protein
MRVHNHDEVFYFLFYFFVCETNNCSYRQCQTVGTCSFMVRIARSLMFFTLLKNTAKQLKLKDPSGGLALMHKLVSKIKVCSMNKIISLSFILGV